MPSSQDASQPGTGEIACAKKGQLAQVARGRAHCSWWSAIWSGCLILPRQRHLLTDKHMTTVWNIVKWYPMLPSIILSKVTLRKAQFANHDSWSRSNARISITTWMCARWNALKTCIYFWIQAIHFKRPMDWSEVKNSGSKITTTMFSEGILKEEERKNSDLLRTRSKNLDALFLVSADKQSPHQPFYYWHSNGQFLSFWCQEAVQNWVVFRESLHHSCTWQHLCTAGVDLLIHSHYKPQLLEFKTFALSNMKRWQRLWGITHLPLSLPPSLHVCVYVCVRETALAAWQIAPLRNAKLLLKTDSTISIISENTKQDLKESSLVWQVTLKNRIAVA